MGYLQTVINATQECDDRKITFKDWCRKILGDFYAEMYSEEYCRRAENFFSAFVNRLTKEQIENITDEDVLEQIEKAKKALESEKIKVQTENLEYRANRRVEARHELFNEKIENAVKNLAPIEYTKNFKREYPSEATGVLCIADAHNGVEIEMKSIFNEVVNRYSPDILKARLNKLLNQVVSDKQMYIDYDNLVVFDLGDAIQSILRLSDIAKLKTGVIQSVIDYAEMISQFLNGLSEGLQIPVEYICLGGNHCELRLIEKGRNFEQENLGLVIREFVSLRLANNPNITVAPYSEFGFKQIQGNNILAIHGDYAKNDNQEISYWENYHQLSIDMLLVGHLHHKNEATTGYAVNGDREVIHVPSLVGADSFSKQCRKLARAGAKFMLFEDGAKTWEKTIYLN